MPLCLQCGLSTLSTAEICSHHVYGHGDDWATANRIMCDFLHRGVVAATPCERDVKGMVRISDARMSGTS